MTNRVSIVWPECR